MLSENALEWTPSQRCFWALLPFTSISLSQPLDLVRRSRSRMWSKLCGGALWEEDAMVELCSAIQECKAWAGSENWSPSHLDHGALEPQLLLGSCVLCYSLSPIPLSFSPRL